MFSLSPSPFLNSHRALFSWNAKRPCFSNSPPRVFSGRSLSELSESTNSLCRPIRAPYSSPRRRLYDPRDLKPIEEVWQMTNEISGQVREHRVRLRKMEKWTLSTGIRPRIKTTRSVHISEEGFEEFRRRLQTLLQEERPLWEEIASVTQNLIGRIERARRKLKNFKEGKQIVCTICDPPRHFSTKNNLTCHHNDFHTGKERYGERERRPTAKQYWWCTLCRIGHMRPGSFREHFYTERHTRLARLAKEADPEWTDSDFNSMTKSIQGHDAAAPTNFCKICDRSFIAASHLKKHLESQDHQKALQIRLKADKVLIPQHIPGYCTVCHKNYGRNLSGHLKTDKHLRLLRLQEKAREESPQQQENRA